MKDIDPKILAVAGRLAESKRNEWWSAINLCYIAFVYFVYAVAIYAFDLGFKLPYAEFWLPDTLLRLLFLFSPILVGSCQLLLAVRLTAKDRKFLKDRGYKLIGSGKGMHLLRKENELLFFVILDH